MESKIALDDDAPTADRHHNHVKPKARIGNISNSAISDLTGKETIDFDRLLLWRVNRRQAVV
jgi:hypothetical protein